MTLETEVRLQKIDRQLAQVGWSEAQGNLVKELTLKNTARDKRIREAKSPYESGNERADYVLKGHNGKPIAIVEAKRDERDPLEGKRQAEDYADHIFALHGVYPFIFLSNGDIHLFFDRERGYAPRQISGFFSPTDLERLAFQRQYSQPLHQFKLKTVIAGGDRYEYQREAVQHITEEMERRKRKFLLVMATGTGKTRTVIGLVDLLMRTRWVQRVLFLADRRELVSQAMGEFKTYLPNEHRARIEGGEVDDEAVLHFATYPSMMQVYQDLSPGYYDLLIADESHRTIYNRYKALFDHFDAMQLGLTATPTDYIDHNTFALFECVDGMPTYYYPYERAVKEEVLVKFRVFAAQTTFQIQGIKAGQLPPEFQRYLEEQNIDLNDVDFEGSDLERRVTNRGTTDALVREFMEKCRKDTSGTLPAKSIIFAISHHHAMELEKSFHRLYPDRPWLIDVIDSRVERAEKLIDDFKRKDMPRVAISVDMLDTGIDVPAIQNLVFAKPVFSLVKFWQMIGRGTRLWKDPLTGQQKESFLIIDHWRNFDFFGLNPEGETPSVTAPLPVSLFRLRLEKLVLLRQRGEEQAAQHAMQQLQEMLAQLPRENVNVRPHSSELERLARASTWEPLEAQMEHLRLTIAPLLRLLPDVNLLAMSFEIHTEQLACAFLQGEQEQIPKLRRHIMRALSQLPWGMPQVQLHTDYMAFIAKDGFWDHLDYERIQKLQATFTLLMRYRQVEHKPMMTLNLPDRVSSRRWIVYGPAGEGAFVDTYRTQVETHIKDLAEQVPLLYKIKYLQTEEPPSLTDMQLIADTLNRPDLFITEEILRRVYERSDVGLLDFLRHILGRRPLLTREERLSVAFDEFIAQYPHLTITQVDFLRAVRSVVLYKTRLDPADPERRLQPSDLEQGPFRRIGSVQRLFKPEEIATIIDFANQQVA